ncbi:MAG: type II toxin-antitoxin system Phd/YefM family antitoxin [Actinomycetota bacterium]
MALRVIGVAQLRDELASVMDDLSEVGEIIVTQRGEGKAVLMELDRYNQLIDRLEFLEDSLDALEGTWEGAVPFE